MTTYKSDELLERRSKLRPLLFNGINYAYWKICMRIHIQSVDWKTYDMIEEGYESLTKQVNGAKNVKLIFEWNEKELKFANLNSKALGTLINGLTQTEFFKVMNITCAKDLWDYLEVTHEGTSHVKKSKINMLVKDFEMFFMKTNEAIYELFNRFKGIANELQALWEGRDVRQDVLRSLPKELNIIIHLLEMVHDINTQKFQELIMMQEVGKTNNPD